MNEPHDPDPTVDTSSAPADSLDPGLAAGFGRPAGAPGSVLSQFRSTLGPLQSVLLGEAEGESALIVKPKSDAMPRADETGDRYQLSGEIARGGMGAVLRGRDVDLGRDLAVKVLLEKYADRPDVARRFIEEAQIGGQLQHPGVVPVYDIGRFGDRPFFTMKLVKGQTLAAILGERSDPAADRPRMLSIALQVAQTLAYAHAKGVIHRDLKPANIMVGAFGEVQVMDWGLAKVLTSGDIAGEDDASCKHERDDVTTIRTSRSSGSGFGADTETGSLLGTPAYMPPEQANGDIANLDRRADVFGLGAILCEILTGMPPYVGRSFEEVRRKAANGDLNDARAGLEACRGDAELITLTKACLAPEAADRPKDAHGVAENLTTYLDGVQERLHKAELAEAEARARAVEEAKRRRLTLALASTVLLAMALGGGGWLWVKTERDARQVALTRDVNEAMNRATALREQAKAANVGAAALSAQAREQAQRALALVESGPTDSMLAAQVRRLQTELDQEGKDRTLVAALDTARLAQAETLAREGRFANERAVPLFREACREYGLPVGVGDPKTAAARIREQPAPVREALLAALDEWDDIATNPAFRFVEPHSDWLQAVLEAAEPDDGFLGQVRTARRESDKARRRSALESLAGSANVRKLPARALTRLAGQLSAPQQTALLRRAQQQYPADFWVNHNLGMMLGFFGTRDLAEAVRFLTAAAALRPESPGCLQNLGTALKDRGQVDEAIACYNKAIELDPEYVGAHYNLAFALGLKGQIDGSIASYRRAIELDPSYAEAYCNLAQGLRQRGRFAESLAAYQRGHELGTKKPGWRYPSAEWVRQAKSRAALDGKLPAFLKGEIQPSGPAERLDLASICLGKKLYYAGARLYAEAFAADRKLADDLAAGHRYNAGCFATLAATGHGEDAAHLDDNARARLRKQALEWLRADLDAWTRVLEKGPRTARAKIIITLKNWQQDSDVAGMRDEAALATLPREEREACAHLWADVAALLKKVTTPATEPKPCPTRIAAPARPPDQRCEPFISSLELNVSPGLSGGSATADVAR